MSLFQSRPLVISTMLAAAVPLCAQTAWDTLGPSNTYHSTTGGIVRGPSHANGVFWTAVQFTSQASGSISELNFAVVRAGGSHANLFSAELWSDDNNSVGTVLTTFGTFNGHLNGEPPAFLAGNGFAITAGTVYWMVVKGEENSDGAWRRASMADPGRRAFTSNLGASWTYVTSDPRYAFRVLVSGEPPCYANCDGSTTPPILNVEDFTCFINEFAAAQSLPHEQQLTHYANCDQSTTAPVLNVEDFTCFINQFAAGCQ
jgi:hypothetical protein